MTLKIEGGGSGDIIITSPSELDEKAKVSPNDTTAGYLNGKLVEGTGISFTENNDGGDETLTIDADNNGDVVGPSSAVDDNIATFDTTTGKLIQDSGLTTAEVTANTSARHAESHTIASHDITATGTEIDTHLGATNNPHATDIENLGAGTLAELNAAISDANVDDDGDSRPPLNHASDHTDGTDDIQDAASPATKGLATGAQIAAIEANTTHSAGDGSDHADVATNTTHSTGDGSDHADVASNTTHSGSDGKDHSDVVTNNAKASNANHSGDATGSTVLTLADDAVTYAKMQNVVADDVILGNVDGAGGIVNELTATEVRTLINVEDGSEANNISDVNATDLTDGGATTLHSHAGGGSSPLTTKGDLYTFTSVDARLPIGTNAYVLTADSAEATGMKWAAATGGSSPLTTKGDLHVYTTVDARLAVGTNDYVLTADSTEASGVKWAAGGGGGGGPTTPGTTVVGRLTTWGDTSGGSLQASRALATGSFLTTGEIYDSTATNQNTPIPWHASSILDTGFSRDMPSLPCTSSTTFTAATKTIRIYPDTGYGGNPRNWWKVGGTISITGTASNPGPFTIASMTPVSIVVNETVAEETTACTITGPLYTVAKVAEAGKYIMSYGLPSILYPPYATGAQTWQSGIYKNGSLIPSTRFDKAVTTGDKAIFNGLTTIVDSVVTTDQFIMLMSLKSGTTGDTILTSNLYGSLIFLRTL